MPIEKRGISFSVLNMLSKNIAIPIERSRVSFESLHENGANKAFAKLALCKMDMAKVWAEEETGFQRKPGLSFNGYIQPKMDTIASAAIQELVTTSQFTDSYPLELPEKTQIYTALQNLVVFYYAGQEEWPDGNRFTATSDIVLDMTHTDLYFAQQS